jgi:hypothetical protein
MQKRSSIPTRKLISRRTVRIFVIGSVVPDDKTATENSNPFSVEFKNISLPR